MTEICGFLPKLCALLRVNLPKPNHDFLGHGGFTAHTWDRQFTLSHFACADVWTGRRPGNVYPARAKQRARCSDAGLIPMFLPDYQSVTDDGVRSAFHEIWNSEGIASEKGLTVTEIMDAVRYANIIDILGENPAMSDPMQRYARAALAKLDHYCTGYFSPKRPIMPM